MDPLDIVTCISNPIRWESRIRLARDAIADWLKEPNVRITLVESAYGARPHELADLAANPRINYVPVRNYSLVWNKESLLNIGISRLAPDAKYIGTFDADIHFRKPGWAGEVIHALQLHEIVQPWRTAYDLGPNDEHIQTHHSFASLFHEGKPVVPSGPHFWKFDGGAYEYAHCLPGDALVVPGGRVLAASARPFEGHLVIIRTAGGKELACTPNHPVLSGENWVRADAINVGDYVVSHVKGDSVLGEPHKQDAPARIEDIARSFSERGGMHRSTAELPDDLDDNRANCKIAEIWADSPLPMEDNPPSLQIGGDPVFGCIGMQSKSLDSQGAGALLLERFDLSAPADETSFPPRFFSKIGGCLFEHPPADQSPDFGAGRSVPSVPNALDPAASQFSCQHSGGVSSSHVRGDVLLDEPPRVSLIHADNLSAFCRALSGQVESDKVVYIGRREFKGHVYDLKTEHGFIISDNIITHNSGYAWAWTRTVLDKIGGLFDLAGTGSADHHQALAIVGAVDKSVPAGTHPNYIAALKTWESRALTHINKNLGFVPGTIEHRFHGSKAARGYLDRWGMFVKHGFDPLVDIKRNSWGVVEWSGAKPDLEREWHLYLKSRNEDGNLV
jgi:hypothetical protein